MADRDGLDEGVRADQNRVRRGLLANSNGPVTGTSRELVTEASDTPLDPEALHEALAILLVQYHRRTQAAMVTQAK
jgi:hypothetical protein